MNPYVIIYVFSVALIVAILIWGELEWYAAILLGFIAPFVGWIFALPIIMFVAIASLKGGSGPGLISIVVVISQMLVLGWAVLLAKSRRKKKRESCTRAEDAGDQTPAAVEQAPH